MIHDLLSLLDSSFFSLKKISKGLRLGMGKLSSYLPLPLTISPSLGSSGFWSLHCLQVNFSVSFSKPQGSLPCRFLMRSKQNNANCQGQFWLAIYITYISVLREPAFLYFSILFCLECFFFSCTSIVPGAFINSRNC